MHVFKVDPGNADALVAKGALCTTTGDFARAVDTLTHALRVDPRHRNAARCGRRRRDRGLALTSHRGVTGRYLETTLLRRAEKLEGEGRLEVGRG